jgi:hypothetical protein
MSHIHILYSRLGSRSEAAIPFVRQIARTDEQSHLLDITRKLMEFQSVVPVNVLAMTPRSQAHFYHRFRVLNASRETRRPLYMGRTEIFTRHVGDTIFLNGTNTLLGQSRRRELLKYQGANK